MNFCTYITTVIADPLKGAVRFTVHQALSIYDLQACNRLELCLVLKKILKMIMSLFYVSFVSFLEKGKTLMLGSVFPVRCQTSFLKQHFNDLTSLDRA